MEHSNKLSNLYLDVQVEIFSYFSPKDFINFACTSKFFWKLFQNGEFWKAYTTKLGPKSIIYTGNIQVTSDEFYNFFKSAAKHFYSKKEEISKEERLSLVPIEASSTDFSQSVEKVLDENKDLFWSSTGRDDEDSKDSLLFMFKKYLVVPFLIKVTFFTAAGFYETGTLEFPSKHIQVLFSLDGQNWEFGSEIVPVNGQREVEIKILGKVGIARYMKIVFIGKCVLQPTDDLYYVAVQKVKCYGYKIDKDDKENVTLNELLINSWTEWKKQQFTSGAMEIEHKNDVIPEILDYYKTQTFSSDIHTEFLNLLKNKNHEETWKYLQCHKHLLVDDNIFIDIYKQGDDFSLYYLEKVISEKKRLALNEHETLLLLLLYSHHVALPVELKSIPQVLNQHYNKQIFLDFQYFQVSTGVLAKVKEASGVGHLTAIEYLKDAKQSKNLSILLFNFISCSRPSYGL